MIRAWILVCWIPFVLFASACGEKKMKPVRETNVYPQGTFEVSQLAGLRVKELLVVLFEKNFQPGEWKRIFDQTKQLSQNKRELREIEGRLDPAADEIRSQKIAENAELLSELGMKSVFLMSWSVADENCRFEGTEEVRLVCRPRSRDNPLNGGLPVPVGAVRWVEPDPVRSEIKIPYLALDLVSEAVPKFSLQLRLKPESVRSQELWFKGEAVPSSDSQFQSWDGEIRAASFPYGYAEITLSP